MAHENELTTCPTTHLKASVENPGPPLAGADADALARREALVADTVAALRGNSIGKVEIVGQGLTASDASRLADAMPLCPSLEECFIRNNDIGDNGAEAVARVIPQCPALNRLILAGNNIGDRGALKIAEVLRDSKIGMLSLSENRIGPTGVAALAAAARDSNSVYLMSLRRNPILDEGLEALALCLPQPADTTSLRSVGVSQCNCTDRGVQVLAKALASSTLHEFFMQYNDIGKEGAIALGDMLIANVHLVAVILNYVHLGDQGATELGRALGRNVTLKQLDISQNGIGDEGAVALSRGLKMNASIVTLLLGGNVIGCDGACALATVVAQKNSLTQLDLVGNPIGERGREALNAAMLQCPGCSVEIADSQVIECTGDLRTCTTKLQNTNPSTIRLYQVFGDESIVASFISAVSQLPRIQSLQLTGVTNCLFVSAFFDYLQTTTMLRSISFEFAFASAEGLTFFFEALAANRSVERISLNSCTTTSMTSKTAFQRGVATCIRTFSVINNKQLEDTEALAFLQGLKTASALEELGFWGNGVSSLIAKAISDLIQTSTTLRIVRLGQNEIDDDSASVLATALTNNTTIHFVELDNNRISDAGAVALGSALAINSSLQELSLNTNQIGDTGASAIAAALKINSSLTTLRLHGNKITEVGVSSFRKPLQQVQVLILSNNPVTVVGVEFLATQSISTVSLSYESLVWPPPSISSQATAGDRSPIYRFLDATAASSSPLMRSRLMLLGHGGAGKTTLKTALLLSTDSDDSIVALRTSMVETIRIRWREADVESWVDNDLARVPGFFKQNCPRARGITGERLLEYTAPEVETVFGAMETEVSRQVVRKMTRVLAFLLAKVETLPIKTETRSFLDWGLAGDFIVEAFKTMSPDFAGMSNPDMIDTPSERVRKQPCEESNKHDHATPRYAALLDIPHVWTEGVELEWWDGGGYTIWDMPGQMELYPAHRMFSASATAVYVVVINGLGGSDSCLAQLRQWLGPLRSGLKHIDSVTKVVARIVVSHTDHLIGIDREALLREVHSVATGRFGEAFDFGNRCFAPLYGESRGGSDSTGVDALRIELVDIQHSAIDRFALPTQYQRICDNVVSLARSDSLSQWPIVPIDSLETGEVSRDDVVRCLQDLGFVRRVGRDWVVLEPVTWLSRLMAAFLHPYHGVSTALAQSGKATTHANHLRQVTVTSKVASRVVNHRSSMVASENEDEVLDLLSNFDVCFLLEGDSYVFPALLPRVTRLPTWLADQVWPRALSQGCVCRRYTPNDIDSLIPAALTSLLVSALARMDNHTVVFLGCCTAILRHQEHGSYFGVHQLSDNSAIDLFATGSSRQQWLGLMTLQLRVLVDEHFPQLGLAKNTLSRTDSLDDEQCDPLVDVIDHVLLSKCALIPVVHQSEWWIVQRTTQPEAVWAQYRTIMTGTTGCREDPSIVARLRTDWRDSTMRRELMMNCEQLCWLIDGDIVSQDGDHIGVAESTPEGLCGYQLLNELFQPCKEVTKLAVEVAKTQSNPGSDPVGPQHCAVSFATLRRIYDQASDLAGDDFPNWTMRDVNNRIVKPLCAEHGKPLALHYSPSGLAAEVFVSHAWREPFKQFAESVFDAYRSDVRKPSLWICTFALMQSEDRTIVTHQIGMTLDEAPFVQALRHVDGVLVVRNRSVDVYSRLWCVCEMYFAHKYGLVPKKARVAGSDAFGKSTTSCLDAQCSDPADRVRILHALCGGSVANPEIVREIDAAIVEFRQFVE